MTIFVAFIFLLVDTLTFQSMETDSIKKDTLPVKRQLLEGHFVLSDLENFRESYEHPDTTIIIKYCGVLPYGSGLPVRNEFVHKISKEITQKWKEFSSKMVFFKQSRSAITIHKHFHEIEKEDQEVDTNNYYLMAKAIRYAPDRLGEATLSQYLLAILVDIVTNAVRLYDLHEDVIDPGDVSSDEYYLERYMKDLYSRPMETNDHMRHLLKLCSSCDFYGKAKRLKAEIQKSGSFKKLIKPEKEPETVLQEKLPAQQIRESGKLSFPRSRESVRKILIDTSEYPNLHLEESILEAIKSSFKSIDLELTLSERSTSDYRFNPIESIIEELLTKVTQKTKPSKEQMMKSPAIKQAAITFIKSMLFDALREHRRNIKATHRTSILKRD